MNEDPSLVAAAASVDDKPHVAPVLVIGAGPAGLAVAACLAQRGIAAEIVERAGAVGSSWRAHYRRLHLHTVKEHSALPHRAFPAEAARYVPRQQVVDYLEDYARAFDLRPHFGVEARAIARRADGRWHIDCGDGLSFLARAVVVATGANARPQRPAFDGEARFRGEILQSASYRDAQPYAGRRVLVVGMGNTGAEIALDLAEQGAHATVSLRSPVNIVLRDILGRPSQVTAMMLSRLPVPLGDAIARISRDLSVGDLRRWGIRTPATSPLRQLREEGRTPVIDVGTLARIRRGDIAVRPGIAAFTPDGVRFENGAAEPFDAVILATGYSAGVADLFPDMRVPVDAKGLPPEVVGTGALAGVYFVGFDTRQPGGLLRTIAQQATRVAADIASAIAAGARLGQEQQHDERQQ